MKTLVQSLTLVLTGYFSLSVLVPNVSLGAKMSWCISDPAHPPCGGARGKCSINSDGSHGGFVADTAFVESRSVLKVFRQRNVPYLASQVQVCGTSRVVGERVRLLGKVQIQGDASVSGSAILCDEVIVSDSARVLGDAEIFDQAKIYGNAEVADQAKVMGQAEVFGDARVVQFAKVCDQAKIRGNALVTGLSQVSGEAVVRGRAQVLDLAVVRGQAHLEGSAVVKDNASVEGEARISGDGQVWDDAHVRDRAQVFDHARILDHAQVFGYAKVFSKAEVGDQARVFDFAEVHGRASVSGDARIGGNARVYGNQRVPFSGSALSNILVINGNSYSPGPGHAFKVPQTREARVFDRKFEGSEAEIYIQYLLKRHFSKRTWKVINLKGERIDIERYHVDGHGIFESGYEILIPELAQELSEALEREVQVGGVVLESEILASEQARERFGIAEPSSFRKNEFARYHDPSEEEFLRPRSKAYLSFLQGAVQEYLAELDQSAGATLFRIRSRNAEKGLYTLKYYQNPFYRSRGGIDIHDSTTREARVMAGLYLNMMGAIERNSETDFLVNLINLATMFHPTVIQARNAFIESYTYLFVAKRFPNREVRQRYLHFTLNCGQIF